MTLFAPRKRLLMESFRHSFLPAHRNLNDYVCDVIRTNHGSPFMNTLIRDATRILQLFYCNYLESVVQSLISDTSSWPCSDPTLPVLSTSNTNKFVNIYRFITVKKMYIHTEHHQTWSFCTDFFFFFCKVALCNYLLQDTCLTIGRHWFSHVRPNTQTNGIFLFFSPSNNTQ